MVEQGSSKNEMLTEAPSEDEIRLHMWQKASFSCDEKGARETADTLRLKLAQLNYHRLTEGLAGRSTDHLDILMRDYLQKYSRVVDERDESNGLNNFTSPALALAAGHNIDRKSWKSGLTFETVMEMPEIKALLTESEAPPSSSRPIIRGPTSTLLAERKQCQQRMLSTATATSSELQLDTPTSCCGPQAVVKKKSNSGVESLNQKQPPSAETRPQHINSKFTKFPSAPSISGTSIDDSHYVPGTVATREGRQRIVRNDRQSTTVGDGGYPIPKRARRMAANDFEQHDGQDKFENRERKNQSFITARDQYHINQLNTRGGRSVNPNSYGMSKRSLGARRTAGGRFVPPIKQDGGDGSSKFGEEVRSRVMTYCGGSGGNGSSALPMELEGNERLKNIEPKMVQLIINEIMDNSAPVQWDDIAGLQYAKEAIKEIVVWPMMRPDLFIGLRGPPKGILLFGPPGTGKTLIGKCIASQVQATFFSISASSLTSKWIGEGEKMVRALFAVAHCYQPAVVFIDEIDSLLSQRSDTEHESSRRIKTEFLVQLDGATTSADDRLLVIGATNRPQEIDEAARRRLVKRLYIPLPECLARRQIVENLMRQQPFSLSEHEFQEISQKTDGYSGADMTNLCREAAYGPVREAAGSLQHISAEEMRPVNFADFEAALKVVKASVSEKDLDLYINWNKQFGCGK